MKSEIIIFFVCGFCLNIDASFQQHRQGAYPKWTNQNYPPNQNPVYPLRQPNYGAPQPVVNYVQGRPKPEYVPVQNANFPPQKHAQESIYAPRQSEQLLQQQVVENQSDDIYVEPSLEIEQQTYPEPSYLASPVLPDRRYENFGVARQPPTWEEAPPARPVYNNPSPHVSRQWPSQNSYQQGPPISQESYPPPASYPHWQSNGYNAVQHQNSYYGGPSDKQNAYNDQVQYNSKAQAQAAKEAASSPKDSMVQEILPSKPKVKDSVAGPHESRYILLYPNGTTEYVDVLNDDLIGKSKHFKSSDILDVKDFKEKVAKNPKENPFINIIRNSPNNHKQIDHSKTPLKNRDILSHSHPNVPKETSDPRPLENHYTNNRFNREYEPIKKYNRNPDEGTSVDKPENYNNRRHNPSNEPLHSLRHDAAPAHSPPVWNNNNNNNYRNPEPKQKHTDDKIHENVPITEENIKKNLRPLPSSDSLPSVDDNNYNPLSHRHSDYPSRVQNSNDDPIISEYVATPATYYEKPVDAPDPLEEPTVSELPHLNQQFPSKSDEIIDRSPFTLPNPSDYEIFDNLDQPQEPNDDTSSVDPQYPEDENPIVKNEDDDATDAPVIEQQDNIDDENTDVLADAKNEDTVTEMKPNTNDAQDISQEISDTNEEKPIIDDALTDIYYSSSTTTSDITTVSPVESASSLMEDSSTDIDTAITVDDNESEQKEEVDLEEKEKPENETDKNEVDVEFSDTLDLENAEKYDEVYFFDIKLIDSYIERTSRTYMTKTNITVEDIEEVVWEHKGDEFPIKIKTTKTIWNPGPGYARPKKIKPAQTEGTEAPDCTT